MEHTDSHYAKGMELIYQRLVDSLKKLGFRADCIGGPAVSIRTCIMRSKSMRPTEAPDGTVLEDYQRGYNFKGRLLRAAMVKVAVAPGLDASKRT